MSDCNDTYTCLGTTECSTGNDSKNPIYVQCPNYSYWSNKTTSATDKTDGNKFKANCKLDGFNGKSCNFWGDNNKNISTDDQTYLKSSNDKQQCKQLQYYALQGDWDNINTRLDASKHCPKNKDAYINQIKYLLCQLQNCRTKFYEDKPAPTFNKNPFKWNKDNWSENAINLIATIITFYFLIIGSISALFQMDSFGQGLAIFDMLKNKTLNNKERFFIAFCIIVLTALIARFIMWITFWFTNKKMSKTTVQTVNGTHGLGAPVETDTMDHIDGPYSDKKTDAIGWGYAGILWAVMLVVLIGIYSSFRMQNSVIWGFPMKFLPRIIIIAILIGFMFWYISSMPSSIYSSDIGDDDKNKLKFVSTNIQEDKKCDTAKQAKIDTNRQFGGNFGEILYYIFPSVIYSCW